MSRRPGRRPVGALVALLVCLAALAGIGLVVMRPARITGIDSKALAASLSGEIDGFGGECGDAGRSWRCVMYLLGGKGSGPTATYRVTTSGWGCWDATRVSRNVRPPGTSPESASACIWVTDYF